MVFPSDISNKINVPAGAPAAAAKAADRCAGELEAATGVAEAAFPVRCCNPFPFRPLCSALILSAAPTPPTPPGGMPPRTPVGSGR